MAFSPCPKCQDKAKFDTQKLDNSGFVVRRAPSRNDGPEFFCTDNTEHKWVTFNSLYLELKEAGY